MPLTSRLDRTTVPALASLAAALVYLRAPFNGLAVDDVTIAAHPLLQSVRTLPAALGAPWWYATGHLYRPLTMALLGVALPAAGGAPWLVHSVSALLHALVAALVARLCTRWMPAPAALGAGLFFALLPAHAEAVATVVGLAELVAGAALVGVMLVVTRDEPPSARTRALVALLSAAALAGKEGGVVAPALALLAAWAYPAARRHAWTWTLPALAGTVVMLMARLAVLGTLGGDIPHPLFSAMGTGARLATAVLMLPRTAAMLLLPVRPAMMYTPPLSLVLSPPTLAMVTGGLLLVLAVVALALHVRRPSAWTLGACVAAVALAPTSNLFLASGVVLSGRSVYAPSIGAALVVGALLARLGETPWRRLAVVPVGGYLAWCAVVAWREVPAWRSSGTAVAAAAERHPDSYWVARSRAYQARDAGRSADAITNFRRAAELFPLDFEMLTDGATIALAQGDSAEAVQWLRAAIAAHPRAARARVRLVSIVRARGDSVEAATLLRDGLRVEPGARTLAGLLAR